jgi:hypothetical protein
MSELTITLTRALFERLRTGQHIWWDDNTGREVLVRVEGAEPTDAYDGAAMAELSPADLDLIEAPDGLIVADVTGTTGWRIRMEAAR